MKKVKPGKAIALILLLFLSSFVFYPSKIFAQDKQPVSWSFYSRRIAPGLYELYTIVTVKEGWRFSPQTSVETAPVVGELTFQQHPNVIEVTKLGSERTVADMTDVVGDKRFQYESNIKLRHLVKLKQPVSTNLLGHIAYTVTNVNAQSLQDAIDFSIILR